MKQLRISLQDQLLISLLERGLIRTFIYYMVRTDILMTDNLCKTLPSLVELKLLINLPAQKRTHVPVWEVFFMDIALALEHLWKSAIALEHEATPPPSGCFAKLNTIISQTFSVNPECEHLCSFMQALHSHCNNDGLSLWGQIT